MRRETTDPTYNFADMIIGVLSYLKLIPNQNESKGQKKGRKVSCGGKERERGGGRFQLQGLYSLIQTPVIVVCPCYSPQYSILSRLRHTNTISEKDKHKSLCICTYKA